MRGFPLFSSCFPCYAAERSTWAVPAWATLPGDAGERWRAHRLAVLWRCPWAPAVPRGTETPWGWQGTEAAYLRNHCCACSAGGAAESRDARHSSKTSMGTHITSWMCLKAPPVPTPRITQNCCQLPEMCAWTGLRVFKWIKNNYLCSTNRIASASEQMGICNKLWQSRVPSRAGTSSAPHEAVCAPWSCLVPCTSPSCPIPCTCQRLQVIGEWHKAAWLHGMAGTCLPSPCSITAGCYCTPTGS